MTLRDSVPLMRRWRAVILAGVVMGGVVGWLSAPGTVATVTFEATHTMILDPSASDRTLINRAAVLAGLGAVPDRVAVRLRIDQQLVRSMVTAGTRESVGEVLITGRSTDRRQAEALANVTAEELVIELGGAAAPLRTLEPAVASAVASDDVAGPRSRRDRALMLAVFGLVLGIGAAFAVERFDNRIGSKSAAEEVLGVPVMAEVPFIPRSDRDRLLTTGAPSSFLEAYRGLRTGFDRWIPRADNGRGPVIVVTSPTAGEGKTVTVAHLAVTLAEIGRSVVVISADLRRPRLHLYFDRPREPGLADVLRGAPDTRRLTDLNLVTAVRGVSFVSSGTPVDNPSAILDRIGDHLDSARSLADIVLIDSPPLLTASEAADLARHADGVLLVVRAGRTSTGAAARSVELLERLGIPVVGAVLVASDASALRRR